MKYNSACVCNKSSLWNDVTEKQDEDGLSSYRDFQFRRRLSEEVYYRKELQRENNLRLTVSVTQQQTATFYTTTYWDWLLQQQQ